MEEARGPVMGIAEWSVSDVQHSLDGMVRDDLSLNLGPRRGGVDRERSPDRNTVSEKTLRPKELGECWRPVEKRL